jgi:hypothetical protein
MLCINLDIKGIGLHFGRFFNKLIWSSCLEDLTKCGMTKHFLSPMSCHSCQWLCYPISSCRFITDKVARCQSDQIGRIFAYWAIVYIGQFFKLPKYVALILGHFFHGKKCCINFGKKWVGLHFRPLPNIHILK